ncbi:MAG TPA: ABC transporter permease [Gemmatimonadaceae bacterium]|nr:ABC transporter permease [Gemmatimonadaceae bacterium]
MHRLTRLARPAAVPLVAVAGILLLLAALLVAGGHDPAVALRALWRGAFGSADALLSATLVRATPLILAGLSVALAFRAGLLNIGAEGQLLAGAGAAAAVGILFGAALGPAAVLVVLAAGALAGAAWAGIAAALRLRGVPEVISTLMLNFVALYGVGYLVRGPLQEPSHVYPQSLPLPESARLPVLLPHTRLHAGIVVALAAAAVLWYALQHTAAGFRVRASGANPDAARSAGGIAVARTTAGAFLASGVLAGLAGASEVQGVTYALYENLSPGYGYTAIAVALLAGLDPRLVVPSGILFGALEAGAGAMQRDAGVPAAVVTVVEAAVILAVLAVTRVRRAER